MTTPQRADHTPATRVEVVATWRRWMRSQGYTRATIRMREHVIRSLLNHADVDDVAQLTQDHVLAYLGEGSATWSTWTRATYHSAINSWSKSIRRPDLVEGVRKVRTPACVPKPAAEHELAALLSVATSERDRTWVLLAAFCGLRAHEVAQVRGGDLERAPDGSWLLRVLGKGGQLAVVPCPPVVVEALAGAPHGRIWPKATPAAVSAAVRKLAQLAGVRVSCHQLRHRYGTVVYETSGHDLLLTQQMMRHTSPTYTAGYAKVASSRAGTVALALPGSGAQQLPPTTPPAGEQVTAAVRHLRLVQ